MIAFPHNRSWLPRVSVALWLAFFLALTYSSWRLVLISADGDACLHRRIGSWMIENRTVLRADEFSHTRLGAPYVGKEWLSAVVFAAAGNALDWNGVVLVAAALIATTMMLLYRQLRAQGCELVLAAGLTLAAAWACSMHWLGRPHLVTHLFTVLLVWQLRKWERGGPVRLLWFVPGLMLLWANLHGAFFTGFVILGIFWIGSVWERRWSQLGALTLAGTLGLVASLINPQGWNLHRQVIGFLQTPLLAQLTDEFRSPNFHSSATHGLLFLFLLLAFVLLVVRPRWRATDLLLVSVWGYFALRSVRNIPIFALVTAPVLAGYLNDYLRDLPAGRWVVFYRQFAARVAGRDHAADGRLLAALLVVGTIVVVAWPGRTLLATEPLREVFPATAVAFLKQNPTAVRGNMFNDYGWGGYLMLYLPEHKVFVDGRNDFYGGEFIREFDIVDEVAPGWAEVLRRYDVGWTILRTNHALNVVLSLRTNEWQEIHRSGPAVIFGRHAPTVSTESPSE